MAKEFGIEEKLSDDELDEVAGGMAVNKKNYKVVTAVERHTLSGGKTDNSKDNVPGPKKPTATFC
jgi:hypothetical protein